jgi:hypothetical protein
VIEVYRSVPTVAGCDQLPLHFRSLHDTKWVAEHLKSGAFMRKYLKKATAATAFIFALSLPTILGQSGAIAQTTSQTCMDMGGGMVSCQGRISDDQQDGQEVLGAAVGKLIFGDREKRFRKHIGAMLADGKCREAAEYAYREGRLEIGSQIAQSCGQPKDSGHSQMTPESLQNAVKRVADNANVPFQFDANTTVTRVDAVGTQLVFLVDLKTDQKAITDEARLGVSNFLCADEMSPTILGAGASMRVLFRNAGGSEVGAVMVNRAICGF